MKIAFVHQHAWSYVQRDLDILRSPHEVREHEIPSPGKWNLSTLSSVVSLWADVRWCDVVFCWFGKLHAFIGTVFAKIWRKPVVVVAGDDDVCSFAYDGRKFGMYSFPWKRPFADYVFRHARLVLAVSKQGMRETVMNAKVDLDRLRLVYHGFDHRYFQQGAQAAKEPLVLTISRVEPDALQKGLELFVRTAEKIPDVHFMLVGPLLDQSTTRWLSDLAPPNVTLTGWVEADEFIHILRRTQVYVQASFHEGFGCAVAEAMLCECVPVVSRRAALPEVVGKAGYYIDALTVEDLTEAIRKALVDKDMGRKARERIVGNFPLEKRRRQILAALEALFPENETRH